MSEYRLEMCDVVKTFPGVKALNHAQLKLKPGTVHALMGENGAGKSTLMKCMFGIYHMDEGKVIYEGQEVQIKGPLDALNRGIAMVHQELQPIPERSIGENIYVGRYPTKKYGPITVIDHDKMYEDAAKVLKEVDLNKTRLEREIDSLPADAKYRERKLHDMTLRLDSLYDVIVELEEKIEDAKLRRDAIKQQAITLENIYKIMVNFDCVYNIINDEEKRNVVTALIKEIEIYRNDESEYPLKRIGLNFPVFKDGGEVTELLWDKGNTVESW